MLEKTFIVFPRITAREERLLWEAGIVSWDDFAAAGETELKTVLGRIPRKSLRCIEPYRERLRAGDAAFFNGRLPARERFRALPDFASSVCYLDIETTGSNQKPERITVIGCFDGSKPAVFRRNANLGACLAFLERFHLLVTYGGTRFDIPMLEKYFGRSMHRHLHIDLRPTFLALGINKGLKRLETDYGLQRPQELSGTDGYHAIQLWREYRRTGNKDALRKLIGYNLSDAVHLEPLMRIAYNTHVRDRRLPFTELEGPAPEKFREIIERGVVDAVS